MNKGTGSERRDVGLSVRGKAGEIFKRVIKTCVCVCACARLSVHAFLFVANVRLGVQIYAGYGCMRVCRFVRDMVRVCRFARDMVPCVCACRVAPGFVVCKRANAIVRGAFVHATVYLRGGGNVSFLCCVCLNVCKIGV